MSGYDEVQEHVLSHHERTCSCPGAEQARRRKMMEGLNETEKRLFAYFESINPSFLLCYNEDYDLVGNLVESHSHLRALNKAHWEAEARLLRRLSFLPVWLVVRIRNALFGSAE